MAKCECGTQQRRHMPSGSSCSWCKLRIEKVHHLASPQKTVIKFVPGPDLPSPSHGETRTMMGMFFCSECNVITGRECFVCGNTKNKTLVCDRHHREMH